MRLTMHTYLVALDEHGVYAAAVLRARGYHPKVILAKAEKASGKGYSDFGVSPWMSWITNRGRKFLSAPPCPPVIDAHPDTVAACEATPTPEKEGTTT